MAPTDRDRVTEGASIFPRVRNRDLSARGCGAFTVVKWEHRISFVLILGMWDMGPGLIVAPRGILSARSCGLAGKPSPDSAG